MAYSDKRTQSKLVRRKMLACRKRLQLTCKEVAAIALMSDKYYIKIENGQATPSRITMMKIASALKVDKWYDLYELQAIE